MVNLAKLIESGLKGNQSFEEIKTKLLSEGYLEHDIDFAANNLLDARSKTKEEGTLEKNLNKKIILDRIGYGFGATQFINILFSMTGASLFFIGLINVIKSSVNTLLSGFLSEYSNRKKLSGKFIRISGLIFGFSFIFLALSVSIRSDVLFAVSLLLGSIGVVSYGDSFRKNIIKKMGQMNFYAVISKFAFIGILITAISIVISGYIMELIPVGGKLFFLNFTGYKLPFRAYGYLISFFITAVVSIFSASILAKMNVESENKDDLSFKESLQYYTGMLKSKIKRYLRNKYLFIITFATLVTAIFQSLLGSFMGIYIYFNYMDVAFKGFMNVAVIFGVALFISYFGPILAAKLNKYLGLAPMLVFGAITMTFLPLTIVFNPTSYFPAVLVAASFTMLGVAILGTGQSLIVSRLLNENDRETYYASAGAVTIIPFIVVVAILSWFANSFGILALFRIISVGAIMTLIPIYLILVFWSTKKHI